MCITEDVKNSYKFPFGTEGREMLAGMNESASVLNTFDADGMVDDAHRIVKELGANDGGNCGFCSYCSGGMVHQTPQH